MGYEAETIKAEPVTVPADMVDELRKTLFNDQPEHGYSWVGRIGADNDPPDVFASYGFIVTVRGDPFVRSDVAWRQNVMLDDLPDDVGFIVNDWDGTKLGSDFDTMLGLLAQHSDGQRAEWVFLGEDGSLWATVFEGGTAEDREVEVRVS